MQRYGLDSAHSYTAPSLASIPALKMSDVELDLFPDMNIHFFIEEGIRRGISMITHLFAQANVPGMEKYDETKPNQYKSTRFCFELCYVDTSRKDVFIIIRNVIKTNYRIVNSQTQPEYLVSYQSRSSS